MRYARPLVERIVIGIVAAPVSLGGADIEPIDRAGRTWPAVSKSAPSRV